ncbi:hypothetical protein HPT25_24365 [Bacillus sp. BRMEA1]|uniref:hypothetical protein n=1 Tax=Neobacillus endophyticus TaxID=2738405 RepID=UPI001565EAAA|nr:hypothetical protein [Neobacillus endophyticus]NRD80461.1 hypothetical protein [Neobacillus endophyticus]
MLEIIQEHKDGVDCDSCRNPNVDYIIETDYIVMDFCKECFEGLKKKMMNA